MSTEIKESRNNLIGVIALLAFVLVILWVTGYFKGIYVVVDDETGCHYMAGKQVGITPRLDASGKQICTGETNEH